MQNTCTNMNRQKVYQPRSIIYYRNLTCLSHQINSSYSAHFDYIGIIKNLLLYKYGKCFPLQFRRAFRFHTKVYIGYTTLISITFTECRCYIKILLASAYFIKSMWLERCFLLIAGKMIRDRASCFVHSV